MTNSLKVINKNPEWYADGLHFQCTGCGKCCTGAPGYVWVDTKEIEQMAGYLKLSLVEFSRRYLRQIDGKFSLKEHVVSYDCVFLKDKQCSIYSVRPSQCRTYPFWGKILASSQDWEQEAYACEGIREHFPKVPFEKIQQQLSISLKIDEL